MVIWAASGVGILLSINIFSASAFVAFADNEESHVTIVFALSVVNVVPVPGVLFSGPLMKSEAFLAASESSFSARLSGDLLSSFVRLPIPCHHAIGKIGSDLNAVSPKSCTLLPIPSPILLDLIAAKTIIHISPIAKKFTISQENRSIASHQGNLENSKLVIPPKFKASFPVVSGFILVIPSVSLIAELVFGEVNPLTSAVMKIREILRAATVITGAKMIHITAFTLR